MSRLPDREARARLPEDGGPDHNRLIHSQSPYLLQHAGNPVDWYPWGDEAFARARELDRPIFLSVGYSTCHWCHVMERESFENPAIAACLDEHYVAIKVDREERPELDELYMTVTQLMTGRGGWPNSVWLTPDGRPWYAGTYFPPEDQGERPGFLTILRQLAAVWRDRRADVEDQATQIVTATRELSETRKWIGEPRRELVDSALLEIQRAFDEVHGGFGTAPKFPPHGALALIGDELERRSTPELEAVLVGTLRAMARGGLHDQVGGGFHRYSTDQFWLLPHFEKMLYDNAPLALAYAEAAVRFDDDEFRRTAHRTYEWVLAEMTDPEGGFHSAQDADTEGEEGRFYVWTTEELEEVLGPESARWVSEVMAVEASGNFRDEATHRRTGANVLRWSGPPAEVAEKLGLSPSALWDRWNEERARLAAARARRPRPYQDDKVIAAWNGLMIQSLARGGQRLSEPRYVEAARRAADFILDRLVTAGGTLLRTYREGDARIPGYLEDYAAVIDGLLELHAVVSEPRYLEAAEALADRMVELFSDETDGGFFFVGVEHESVLVRTKDVFDQAVPSGNGLAALALERLARTAQRTDLRDRAWQTVAALQGAVLKHPRGTETLTRAMARLLSTSREAGSDGAAAAGDHIQREAWEARLDVDRARVAPGAPLSWTVVVEPRREGSHIDVSSVTLTGPDADRWGDLETRAQAGSRGRVEIEGRVHAPKIDAGAAAVLFEIELTVVVCDDERCAPADRDRLAVAIAVRPPRP